ncbi:hypothetical protein B0H14DRAFT_2559114 [Mycena olivaceomarginata]|nr:hypothetical protein B0H14DRAFT_2559114 [Mycena olivaceomarginata]
MQAWDLARNVGLSSVSDSAYSSITRWTSSSELGKSEAIINVTVLELRRFRGGDGKNVIFDNIIRIYVGRPDSAIPSRLSCPECQLCAAEDEKKRCTFILLITDFLSWWTSNSDGGYLPSPRNRELAQKPHEPHAAFGRCAKPRAEAKAEGREKLSWWKGRYGGAYLTHQKAKTNPPKCREFCAMAESRMRLVRLLRKLSNIVHLLDSLLCMYFMGKMMDGNVIKVPGDGEKIEVGRKAGKGQNLGSGCQHEGFKERLKSTTCIYPVNSGTHRAGAGQSPADAILG